uniref:Uncharacterized protein n=1 Tax=Strongyloides papillosus TaxID=174720 RepID=A0A0N5C3P6_STREA
MVFRKNFSILLLFVILSISWKVCKFQPIHGGPYGGYGTFGGFGGYGRLGGYGGFGPGHHFGPPGLRPHGFGMRPPPPFMHHPVGIRRPGPMFPPPLMGPGHHHLFGRYRL